MSDRESKTNGNTDCDLVGKTLGGDTDSFGELVRRYDGVVRGIVRRSIYRPGAKACSDEEDDLTQQALVTAFEKLKNLRDCRRFESWIWGITSRICWKWGSRGRKRVAPTVGTGADVASKSDSMTSAERLELRCKIGEAIASLPEEWQSSVLLRYLDGLKYREVAAALGESEGKVRAQITRGSQRLRKKLSAVWKDIRPGVRFDLPDAIDDVLEHHPGSVMVIADDYGIMAVNDAYSQQTGYSAASVTGLTCHKISHGSDTPCDGAEHPCPMALIGESQGQVSVTHRHRDRDGEIEEVDIVTFPVDETLPNGRVRRYYIEMIEPHDET